MKINTKIKPSSLFLDLHPNAFLIIDGNAAGDIEDKHQSLQERVDTFKFITRKDASNEPSSFYFLVEYENMFYNELRRLLQILDESPELDVYITPIGRFKDDKWDIFHNIIQPKLLTAFKDRDVTFLWDPNTIDEDIKSFWGFIDVTGKYNIFYKDDPAVPFKHEYAVNYFEVQAKDKEHAKQLAQEKTNVNN